MQTSDERASGGMCPIEAVTNARIHSERESPVSSPAVVVIVRFVGVQPPGIEASLEGALLALPDTIARLPQRDFPIDLSRYRDDVAAGRWGALNAHVRQRATELLQLLASLSNPHVHVFAVAEVPALIAFGAYVGDSVVLVLHDYNRDEANWSWPEAEPTFRVVISDLPEGKIDTPYDAVLRIMMSYEVATTDVSSIVAGPLADVIVRPADGAPSPQRVQSAADVTEIACVVRQAVHEILQHRPAITVLHLLASVRGSVAVAIGRELKLHNIPPVQLYRFRTGTNPHHTAAILLGAPDTRDVYPLTTDELDLAERIRADCLMPAFQYVKSHAASVRVRRVEEGVPPEQTTPWYLGMYPQEALLSARPFQNLPSLAHLVDPDDSVSETPKPDDVDRPYHFDKDTRVWRLTDRLLLGFWIAADSNIEAARRLLRLFFYHEYLHDHHSIRKTTAEEIGSFANGLEYLDYLADSYALLHEIDAAAVDGELGVDAGESLPLALGIERALRSFWVFEPSPPPSRSWQERRLRRYLNWYWRHVQVKRARSYHDAYQLMSHPPHVELAGLKHSGAGRYVWVDLSNPDPEPHLALGIVREDETFDRYVGTANAPLGELLDAFIHHDHNRIVTFFGSVFDFLS